MVNSIKRHTTESGILSNEKSFNLSFFIEYYGPSWHTLLETNATPDKESVEGYRDDSVH